MRFLSLSSVTLVVLGACSSLLARPVEFTFRPTEPVSRNPFAREIWVRVHTPLGPVEAPAYYAGQGAWAVRLRATSPGTFRLGAITETTAAASQALPTAIVGRHEIEVNASDVARAAVALDTRDPRFFRAGESPYYPLGINLAWPAHGDPDAFYPRAFAEFAAAGLNWTRVWMSHWGALNLDWRVPEQAPSPPLGQLDLAVAAHWDRLIAAAETSGVRVQVVLQHHGQVSTRVNSNWTENPWNVANGGFLRSPAEFFTSPTARELTRRKYRYIVARWGYSPAVLAWELFNESMYVDARYTPPVDDAAVAAWSAEMTRTLRRYDIHHHLVTTSDNALDHLLQGPVDYLQPHLYGANMLAGVRAYDVDPATLDRPVFYGEVGADNMLGLTRDQVDSGITAAPLMWSSLMGAGLHAAQPWYWERVRRHDRLGEFAALTRFVRESGFADAPASLQPVFPTVNSATAVPLVVRPALNWKPSPDPVVRLPLDGRETAALSEIARHLVSPARSGSAGYPSRLTLLADYPQDTRATLHFPRAGPGGGGLRVVVDNLIKAEHRWPGTPAPAPLAIVETVAVPGDSRQEPVPSPPTESVATKPPAPSDAMRLEAPPELPRAPFTEEPVDITLSLSAGPHTIEIANVEGDDWIEFGGMETGLDVPALAAVGKASPDRIYLWVWHREGVFALTTLPPVTGTVEVPEVPAGDWEVTWWDGVSGQPTAPTMLTHAGGTLRLPTPAISRHGAASIRRR